MRSCEIRRTEWVFIGFLMAAWIAALLILPPDISSVDVYLFRDAACNLVADRGFWTASFEHSHSFHPLLYSSYTPGTLWLFSAAAKVFGYGPTMFRIYGIFWALLADAVVLVVGLRFLVRSWQRWAFLALLGIVLPAGAMAGEPERPESVSLIVLLALIAVMRRRPDIKTICAAALIGAAAFLCQPFAGVVACFLIGGWLFVFILANRQESKGRGRGASAASFLAKSALAALLFLVPLVATEAVFYRIDHSSLERFWKQATVAGLSRDATYTAGSASPTPTALGYGRTKPSAGQKYKEALGFYIAKGLISVFNFTGWLAVIAVWAWLAAAAIKRRQTTGWAPVFSLSAAGAVCLLLPLLVFPLQGNYLALGCLVFPLLLAADWACSRSSLKNTAAIPLLLSINMFFLVPSVTLQVIRLSENRSSYREAARQVRLLQEYLAEHPLHGKVVLVPVSHYALYKQAVGNIYNPEYLSSYEDPDQVGAVVNCYTATRNLRPGTLALPAFVSKEPWKLLSATSRPVVVTLLHHKLMSRNWGMGCDLYVPPGPAAPPGK